MSTSIKNVKEFTATSMFVAIILLMAFTPVGFIQLGFIKATIIHVPVIIGSIILGPQIGAFLGLLFGVTSMINNTFMPAVLSFVFSPMIPVPGTAKGSMLALIICFIPRILVGIVPYYVYQLLQKLTKEKSSLEYISLAIAGVSGAMTNTLLVMHLIYFLFKDAYAAVKNMPGDVVYGAILTIIGVNGVPEALVAGLITAAVGKAALMYQRRAI